MSTVGEKLKKAREKKHFSLEHVSQKTKIHPKILEAIEEDRAHHYLSKVYIKGFLKSYAHLVGVAEEEILQGYPLEGAQGASPLPPSMPETLESSSWEEERGVTPWVARTVVVILIFGTLLIVGAGISKMGGEKQIRVETRPLSPEVPKRNWASYPFHISKNEPLKLKLHAAENSWISVSADNHLMYQGLLTKGKEETWTATQSFELSLSDGGAVSFGLNRRSLGILGEKGRPLEKLVMTRDGWRLKEKE